MKSNYQGIITKNGLKVNKITIRGKTTIIDTPLGLFALKKNTGIDIYDYLLSRGFNYIPKIIDYDSDTILFEYINNINYDENERAYDYIRIMSFLHLKTSYFKECDSLEYKELFDKINNIIDDLNGYYLDLSNYIESVQYMSPSEYLIIRNISIIFSNLNYLKNELKNWYDLVKDKNKKRVATLLNKIDINNLLKSKDGIYLSNLDNTSTNSPIYDLFNFYKKYSNLFNFNSLLKNYKKIYPLSEDENKLLFILISIPDKIKINNTINGIREIKSKINKIYITLNVLNFEEEEKRNTHKQEDNK